MIDQKAREIGDYVFNESKGIVARKADLNEAARLGIIEGLEMAAKVADGWSDSPTGYRIAKAIRALIEEQK